ncbi:MAG: hypothetical protein KKB51_00755 [Candidatus Riflebacteria bacterium]|nr:hypothetical protein [Candidatus Riflebacteria bacterium]
MVTISEVFGKKLVGFIALALFVLSGVAAFALTTGAREIAHFEREALRCAREVFRVPGQFTGNDYVVELNNQTIRETQIKSAKIAFSGLEQRDLKKFSTNDFDFSTLKEAGGIEVEAFIEAGAVQNLISREMNRISAGRRIFDSVVLDFGNDRVMVSGKIDLQKVPGNPFMFLPQQMSPFAATVSVKASGSQISLEILDGQMNEQPLTPELNKMLLDWLNPIWDFNALPYQASLDSLQFSPVGVEFSGSLFR